MKLHLFAAAATVALALSGQVATTSALSVEEAATMRDSILEEIKLAKQKDREQRKRFRDVDLDASGADAEGSGDAGGSRGGRRGGKFDALRARSARTKQKILNVKLNILDLAGTASEEDLDAMLAIYDQMEAVHAENAAADDVEKKRAPGRDPRMKEHRKALDEIAEQYGGLKRGRRGAGPGRNGLDGLVGDRAFSEEDARKVKELRKQIKDAGSQEERKALREQLQGVYGNLKFGDRDERRARKEARRKQKDADADARRAAREEERQQRKAERELRKPSKDKLKGRKERPERPTRKDRGQGEPPKKPEPPKNLDAVPPTASE